jgi:hypothetical protein
MDSVEAALADLTKESREQIDRVVAVIGTSSGSEGGVAAEKVAVLLACRLDDEAPVSLLLPTLAMMDALSLRIKTNQDVMAAEIMGYFFRMLHPDRVLARACRGVTPAIKARVKGYLKRWVARGCLTNQQCDEVLKAVDGGSSFVATQETSTAKAQAPGDNSPQDMQPPSSAAGSFPEKTIVDETGRLLTSVSQLLSQVPLDAGVLIGSRLSKLRVSGELSIEAPTEHTIELLRTIESELAAALAVQKRKEEAAAHAQASALVGASVSTVVTVGMLQDVIEHRQDAAAAATERAEQQGVGATSSYQRWLESDVGGHNGRIAAQPGLEFLSLGAKATDAQTFLNPRSEGIVRRPFRLPSRNTTAPGSAGYSRAWGISDEQWAVERDMSKVVFVKPRAQQQRPSDVEVVVGGGRKRDRE